jgi:hypothetical protein
VGVDLSRIANAAVEAALEDGRPRRRLRGVRAVAAGVALAAAARVAVAKAPGVPRLLDGVTHLPDEARRRLTDMGWLDEEPEEEEYFDEEEEPEAVAEEEELEEEPEAEEELDEEEEPADEDPSPNGGEPTGAPPLALSARRSPPVMTRARRDEGLHPADRPPEPPETDSHDNANGRSG